MTLVRSLFSLQVVTGAITKIMDFGNDAEITSLKITEISLKSRKFVKLRANSHKLAEKGRKTGEIRLFWPIFG